MLPCPICVRVFFYSFKEVGGTALGTYQRMVHPTILTPRVDPGQEWIETGLTSPTAHGQRVPRQSSEPEAEGQSIYEPYLLVP